MKIILLLIAVSLLLAVGFLVAFFWAVKSGQYEDEYTPSVRILFDGCTTKQVADPPTAMDESQSILLNNSSNSKLETQIS
ncbi:MAG: cbb3-type cytochrome oxidase assembly protein CcoS [Bacteroidetes bacterium]|nr:cbb3-type cytochrome oxidase assembly protein CcoS [Bacteroidota bacterium]